MQHERDIFTYSHVSDDHHVRLLVLKLANVDLSCCKRKKGLQYTCLILRCLASVWRPSDITCPDQTVDIKPSYQIRAYRADDNYTKNVEIK